ncbi:MAG: chloride channel protein [Clostridium fessum]
MSSLAGLADFIRRGDCDCFDASDRFDPLQRKRRLLIEKCFEGEGLPWDFLIKILFTTVTLEAGFKGGEIVPTLTIGAAFGSFFAFLFGQPVGLMTACGMLGLFVGVTNCPISTLLLGFELFGYEAMPFFVLVIAVSFSFSGYYSLYASQKFIYSKTRTEFINRKTNK